ncbi:MAG: tetratricopeptide repeat protein [Proteobacteria bacterium]|nr:tetratricopeptide repeat protein [Pseudomonadota bacterium]MBU4296519.1 tetratricopeptide repeat protein [Pseudomonadota bacterium]MCG2746900.1 tetratricopeptide repeat protein [Desulfobulbaceae bacterium]
MTSSIMAMLRCPLPIALRRSFLSILLFCSLVLLLSACAPQPQVPAPDQEVFVSLSATLRSKALEYENRGDLRQALLRWSILQTLNPRDKEITAKVEKLKRETRAKATEHFQQGVVFFQQGLLADARREFLYTLTYEQDHPEALDYLLNRLQDNVFTTYQVQKGDTCKEIARKIYHDPDKEFLVTVFNKVDSSCQLSPGTDLKLVVLDQNPAKFADAMPQQDGARVHAPGRQKSKEMADVYSPGEAGASNEAQAVEGGAKQNALKYDQAGKLLDQKKYVEALRLLHTIDADYRDVAKLVAATDTSIQQEADSHYRKGISYYLSEDLDKAIKEWEEVLRLRPDDLKAKKDLLNARRLKEKIKKF